MTTLPELARTHCAACGNRLTIAGFVRDHYCVSRQFFSHVSTGRRKPSSKLLLGLANTHARLFPDSPVILSLPHHPPVILGHQPQN
jgi:hypothetical protein